mmetsp:Transcript_38293/g.113511  ORF Transcript_38293/g.113511 Transcript_38293/m.113511 type:complete len:925 (-) Transcript_38293:399-3173(-)
MAARNLGTFLRVLVFVIAVVIVAADAMVMSLHLHAAKQLVLMLLLLLLLLLRRRRQRWRLLFLCCTVAAGGCAMHAAVSSAATLPHHLCGSVEAAPCIAHEARMVVHRAHACGAHVVSCRMHVHCVHAARRMDRASMHGARATACGAHAARYGCRTATHGACTMADGVHATAHGGAWDLMVRRSPAHANANAARGVFQSLCFSLGSTTPCEGRHGDIPVAHVPVTRLLRGHRRRRTRGRPACGSDAGPSSLGPPRQMQQPSPASSLSAEGLGDPTAASSVLDQPAPSSSDGGDLASWSAVPSRRASSSAVAGHPNSTPPGVQDPLADAAVEGLLHGRELLVLWDIENVRLALPVLSVPVQVYRLKAALLRLGCSSLRVSAFVNPRSRAVLEDSGTVELLAAAGVALGLCSGFSDAADRELICVGYEFGREMRENGAVAVISGDQGFCELLRYLGSLGVVTISVAPHRARRAAAMAGALPPLHRMPLPLASHVSMVWGAAPARPAAFAAAVTASASSATSVAASASRATPANASSATHMSRATAPAAAAAAAACTASTDASAAAGGSAGCTGPLLATAPVTKPEETVRVTKPEATVRVTEHEARDARRCIARALCGKVAAPGAAFLGGPARGSPLTGVPLQVEAALSSGHPPLAAVVSSEQRPASRSLKADVNGSSGDGCSSRGFLNGSSGSGGCSSRELQSSSSGAVSSHGGSGCSGGNCGSTTGDVGHAECSSSSNGGRGKDSSSSKTDSNTGNSSGNSSSGDSSSLESAGSRGSGGHTQGSHSWVTLMGYTHGSHCSLLLPGVNGRAALRAALSDSPPAWLLSRHAIGVGPDVPPKSLGLPLSVSGPPFPRGGLVERRHRHSGRHSADLRGARGRGPRAGHVARDGDASHGVPGCVTQVWINEAAMCAHPVTEQLLRTLRRQ